MDKQAWLVKPDAGPPTWSQFKSVRGVDTLNKPGRNHGQRLGLWTSTWLGEGRLSGWAEWCGAEEFAGPDYRVYLLVADPVVKVWEIDTLADLQALLDSYGAEGEMFRVLGHGGGMFPEMDFDRFAADGYVGVHLTNAGQWRTRYPDLSERGWGEAPSLYGWDCESTLWCSWAFSEVEDLGVMTWVAGDDDE